MPTAERISEVLNDPNTTIRFIGPEDNPQAYVIVDGAKVDVTTEAAPPPVPVYGASSRQTARGGGSVQLRQLRQGERYVNIYTGRVKAQLGSSDNPAEWAIVSVYDIQRNSGGEGGSSERRSSGGAPTSTPSTPGASSTPSTPSTGGNIPPPPGYAYAIDPLTNATTLIDLTPLDTTQPLAGWKWVVDDPSAPDSGKWEFLPSTEVLNEPFQGVPDAVIPWLSASLDAGGDLGIVPEGPAREWVRYLINQEVARRPPTEVPFGLGLPNFPEPNIPSPPPPVEAPVEPPPATEPPPQPRDVEYPSEELGPRPSTVDQWLDQFNKVVVQPKQAATTSMSNIPPPPEPTKEERAPSQKRRPSQKRDTSRKRQTTQRTVFGSRRII